MYENYGWKYLVTAAIAVLWGLAIWINGIPRGLDLSGGSEIIYHLDFGAKTPSTSLTDDVVDVLRQRVDVLGIKELTIRRQGNYDVVVQIPTATEEQVERIRHQIETSGVLQFKLVVDTLGPDDKERQIQRVLREKALGLWREDDRYDVGVYAQTGRGMQGGYELLENATASKPLYVDGSLLADAYRTLDNTNKPCVGFEWNAEGAKKFYDMTEQNVNRQLAVVLDGTIKSAPVIRSAIGRKGIIEGGPEGWKEEEIRNLVVTLKAGALPAKPVFAYHKHVGAQLGRAAVQVGGWAVLGSLLIVTLFMVWYYRSAGLIADFALVLNLFLILGTLAMFGATLTLPGIAGILLTAGMAVDANILIYERIREELARGAALRQGIQAGYERAFWTIFDANLTTAMTALVLMQVGTGPIKGFGLTLTIGIVVSMFTALFVTKALYGFLVAREILTSVNFRTLFAQVNIDFVGKQKAALVLSLTLICGGWLVFLARGQEKYGIDFTGGTALQVRFKHALEKQDVERRVEALPEFDHVEVQRVGEVAEGGIERGYEWALRTREVAAARPGEAPAPAPVEQAGTAPVGTGGAPVAGGDAPASAVNVDQEKFEKAIRREFAAELVDPYPMIEGDQKYTLVEEGGEGGLVRARFRANLVALPDAQGNKTDVTAELVRSELPRVLTAMIQEIDGQLEQLALATSGQGASGRPALEKRKATYQALLGAPGQPGFRVEELQGQDVGYEVEAYLFETHPVENSPVLLEEAVLGLKLALERAQNEGVQVATAQALPSIDQIGAAVARNLKSKAILATIFSVIAICLYVWLRFDLWSGIATIVAVFHDVLALAGFMAILDAVLSATGLAFDVKFNLTTISAFLTLVGYSINDTIVILDRIREDKKAGKIKDYTAEMVNEAVAKTLPRTVLTSLTTLLVCAVLFVASFFGLTAIQGLAVALLFGIIVGTYSTVFIAAPLLLTDRRKIVTGLLAVIGFLVVTSLLNGWM